METTAMRISATIKKLAAENQLCETRVSIHDNVIGASFPYVIDGKKGRGSVKGTCKVTCNTDERIFAVSDLSFSKAGFVQAVDNGKWKSAASTLTIEELEALQVAAKALIINFVAEEKEYLVDNHQDFGIDLRNSMERMFFTNKGVSGSTTLTEKESDMNTIYDENPKNTMRVEFDASYKLEFSSESKEEVLLKDCHINSFTVLRDFEVMVLDTAETDIMKERIIAAIEDNYNDVEHSINGYLGGNPVE